MSNDHNTWTSLSDSRLQESCIDRIQTFNTFFRFIERLIWTVAVVTGFSWAAYLINQNFEDTNANPMMTTIDTVDVTRVPFPAVTVVPGEYPVSPEVDGFTKRLFDYADFERYKTDDILRY